uniref:Uncharacterized protein n=1 Tax=Arundo donax TaxID=35708 RepID=A0A0A9BFB6_ARUDO
MRSHDRHMQPAANNAAFTSKAPMPPKLESMGERTHTRTALILLSSL